ncbi:PREDICTED: protein takeout-like [Dufourea novaeangliae]|uniref:Protein takeout n=1 Tax=Dufourea novaeangliae TaxID=178035 RepID=A0A154P842_DUFNO|nr:PREDICTED: protein takeout-like [Dufourea novaeangliae]KZC08042.1 Protein takeout [Dufourea novaeangliae]
MNTIAVLPLVLLAAVFSGTTGIELPSSFRICKRTLPEQEYYKCVSESARDAVVSLAGGLKSFKILPIEPLAVDSVKIGESQGSVTLRQEYRNIKLHGLTKQLEVKNYRIDWDKCLLTSESYNPQVDFVADYRIDGKILLLPVKGSGKSNITMYDLKTQNEIHCEKYQKNGETYIRVTKYDVKFSPGRVTLRFDNLFDGDTILGEQMNRFINENSDLLFKELQAPYEETFGLVFAKVANDIFIRVPFNKIFPLT